MPCDVDDILKIRASPRLEEALAWGLERLFFSLSS